MDLELRKLFDLRWKERNRVLGEEFLRVKQEMNARGVLNSSMTIQSAHKAMANEFETDRQLISDTIIDFVGQTHAAFPAADSGNIQTVCASAVSQSARNSSSSASGSFAPARVVMLVNMISKIYKHQFSRHDGHHLAIDRGKKGIKLLLLRHKLQFTHLPNRYCASIGSGAISSPVIALVNRLTEKISAREKRPSTYQPPSKTDGYFCSITSTRSITTGSSGTFCMPLRVPVLTASILRTTLMPLLTRPNTA